VIQSSLKEQVLPQELHAKQTGIRSVFQVTSVGLKVRCCVLSAWVKGRDLSVEDKSWRQVHLEWIDIIEVNMVE